MGKRFEAAERQNEAAHAAICQNLKHLGDRLDKSEEQARTDNLALHQRFDTLNQRFDDLYRYLLGSAAKQGAEAS